jgi:hypothetical protein
MECVFEILYGKTRSMLISARLKTSFRSVFGASYESLAVQLENINVKE